jgi:anti-sigma B factor antagonist
VIDINVSGKDHVTLVQVSGRVDSMNAGELGTALSTEIDNGRIKIVLDLAGVDFMSSAGLRELVNSLKRAKKATGDLRLSQPSERVREVLEIAGLDTIFQIYENQNSAVASY